MLYLNFHWEKNKINKKRPGSAHIFFKKKSDSPEKSFKRRNFYSLQLHLMSVLFLFLEYACQHYNINQLANTSKNVSRKNSQFFTFGWINFFFKKVTIYFIHFDQFYFCPRAAAHIFEAAINLSLRMHRSIHAFNPTLSHQFKRSKSK